MCHGVFDVLTPGHVDHLVAAKLAGGENAELVVSVTADEFVNKGPGRPVHNVRERARALTALRVVDRTIINMEADAAQLIEYVVKPDIYAKGYDYVEDGDLAGNLDREREAVERIGGKIVFTETEIRSTTRYLNNAAPPLPEETMEWLRGFRERYSEEDVRRWLDKASKVRVASAGEHIIDEYVTVKPMGRSAKDSIVAWTAEGSNEWAGGIVSVQKHTLAVADSSAGYVMPRQVLLRKRRYVEQPFVNKVFAIYEIESQLNGNEVEYQFEHDLLTVVDYGHGLFDVISIPTLTPPFLALTVQANSMNWGMNTLRKWTKLTNVNYVVLDEAEARLNFQDDHSDPETLLGMMIRDALASVGAITLGHNGCVIADDDVDRWERIPAFATKVVDRIGAGDAFLAVTAPLAAVGAPPAVIGFVGNIAGAIQVGRIGNSKPVERKELRQWVHTLLTL